MADSKPKTAGELIKALGGDKVVAGWLGFTTQASVRNYRCFGMFPARTYLRVVDLGRAKGVEIDPALFTFDPPRPTK